ncbi:MAG: type I glyceraldehyde-3-phosphate dehydrogenase [Candidatus Xenobia bacterium]
MKTRIAINGFGRVGRQSLKAILERQHEHLEVVAINDITDAKTNAYLFKHDSNYGTYPGNVEAKDGGLMIDRHHIKVLAERDPAKLPWKDLNIQIVIESTGLFTDGPKAKAHLDAGAQKVLITAPAKGEDITIVMGVNEDKYDPAKHHIISNASCTTNCLAPVAKIMHEQFGIEYGVMTTIHAYTNDQRILDTPHKDLRRARAAALNIIPTRTGAAQAVALVLPELKGKFAGYAMRVPTPTVSVVDFSVTLSKDATVESINKAMLHAANGPMKGVLEYVDEPLVSMDFKGNPASSIFDAGCTSVVGRLAKVVSWYDNEWGYSNRVADIVAFMAKKSLAHV